MNSPCETSDLLVFSHLRWEMGFQRPQQLMSRFAKHRRVYYFEEPIFGKTQSPRIYLKETDEKVQIIVPHLPEGLSVAEQEVALKNILDELIMEEKLSDFTLWYYTPMALNFSRHLNPEIIIYDCLDECSLPEKESELMTKADVVFTSGQSLYEAKKSMHFNIHSFADSTDYPHFSLGRQSLVEPQDMLHIPHPRIGFFGIIDEQFDIELLVKLADLRPEFHFVMAASITKETQPKLPQRDNIHYLGQKEYHVRPLYLSHVDCAILPLKRNLLTPHLLVNSVMEFLAAGKGVVATTLKDIIHPYADAKLVYIADDPARIIDCLQVAMNESAYDPEWLERVDCFLEANCWDEIFFQMAGLEKEIVTDQEFIINSMQKEVITMPGTL
jgi:UDP-galactopyranose mutase